MKHTMLINAVHKEQKRMATVDEKGKLIEFNIEMSMKDRITGNIYKGKVLKVERGLQAAFVDYGGGKDGFLPLRDVNREYLTESESGQGNKPVLKAGQELLIQAVREVTGNKGALLTSYISLPGRYLVLMPNKPGSGISRKIEDEEDRKKIKSLMGQIKIPENMGFIVRTAGINRTKPEIYRDYQHLMRLWKEIVKKADSVVAPIIVYQETDFGVRSLRDYLTPEIEEIFVDDYDTYRRMRAYMKAAMPRNVKIVVHYKEKIPLFQRFRLEDQISIIYQERVDLKSGGCIIINPTEAMITIDVNSGRGSNKRNIEETAFKTNLVACEEIARQLRLRDLGGLIVIDFIDMMEKKNVAEVEKAFKKALSLDRARIQLSRISKFGLLELSRQKKQPTIQEISYTKCPYCTGSGLRPSLEYAALSAFRKIESEAVKEIYSELKIILPHEIANYILNRKKAELLNMENSFGLTLQISGSEDMTWDKIELQQVFKERVLTDIDLLEEDTGTATTTATATAAVAEATAESPAQENQAGGEITVPKKRRRRPRRRRPSETRQEGGSPENGSLPTAQEKPVQPAENIIPELPAGIIDNKNEEASSASITIEESIIALVDKDPEVQNLPQELEQPVPFIITPLVSEKQEPAQLESTKQPAAKTGRPARSRFNRRRNQTDNSLLNPKE